MPVSTAPDCATLLYFAYGSNMSTARLRARVGSAVAVGVARLSGHRLRWHMASVDGSGKCDIEPGHAQHDAVWGVVWRIRTDERHHLDRAEGLGLAYADRMVDVHADAGVLSVLTYQALRKGEGLAPYHWYRDYVLGGAREHGLPAAYVDAIARVVSIDDPDPVRHAENRRRLRGG